MQAALESDVTINADQAHNLGMEDFQNMLKNMAVYLRHRTKVYSSFPTRFASYWDPVYGRHNLRHDLHWTGKAIFPEFQGMAVLTTSDYLAMGAWRLGLLDSPILLAELIAAASRDLAGVPAWSSSGWMGRISEEQANAEPQPRNNSDVV